MQCRHYVLKSYAILNKARLERIQWTNKLHLIENQKDAHQSLKKNSSSIRLQILDVKNYIIIRKILDTHGKINFSSRCKNICTTRKGLYKTRLVTQLSSPVHFWSINTNHIMTNGNFKPGSCQFCLPITQQQDQMHVTLKIE